MAAKVLGLAHKHINHQLHVPLVCPSSLSESSEKPVKVKPWGHDCREHRSWRCVWCEARFCFVSVFDFLCLPVTCFLNSHKRRLIRFPGLRHRNNSTIEFVQKPSIVPKALFRVAWSKSECCLQTTRVTIRNNTTVFYRSQIYSTEIIEFERRHKSDQEGRRR